MSLADDVEAGPPPVVQGQRRKIDVWFETLSAHDRQAAQSVLSDPSWSHAAIRGVFKRNGLDITETQIGRYRRDRHGSS